MLINTKGAASRLGCSVNWIHKLVSRGDLKSYIFIEGELVEHIPNGESSRQGQGLFFLPGDLDVYQRKPRGRRYGSKDKIENNPNRRGPKRDGMLAEETQRKMSESMKGNQNARKHH